MHEFSITEDILKTVTETAKVNNAKKVTKITLVIGEMSSIIDDSVSLYWELLAENTVAEKAVLEFKRIEANFTCNTCNHVFPLKGSDFKCPNCKSESLKLDDNAKNFYIESVEIE